jgi:class 3 adenylate cyclase
MQTIENWLGQLGLGKYTEAFLDNDVDLRALSHRAPGAWSFAWARKIILAAIKELPPALLSLDALQSRIPEIPHEPTADRRLLSVLFCDLVGSTALSAQLDPEDMHELIRHYKDSVAGAITRFGG